MQPECIWPVSGMHFIMLRWLLMEAQMGLQIGTLWLEFVKHLI